MHEKSLILSYQFCTFHCTLSQLRVSLVNIFIILGRRITRNGCLAHFFACNCLVVASEGFFLPICTQAITGITSVNQTKARSIILFVALRCRVTPSGLRPFFANQRGSAVVVAAKWFVPTGNHLWKKRAIVFIASIHAFAITFSTTPNCIYAGNILEWLSRASKRTIAL